jgi:hypothetical protein
MVYNFKCCEKETTYNISDYGVTYKVKGECGCISFIRQGKCPFCKATYAALYKEAKLFIDTKELFCPSCRREIPSKQAFKDACKTPP